MKFRELKYGQGFTFKGDGHSTYYVKQWRDLYLDPSYRYSRPMRSAPDAEVIPR
jgi:hypothetical protein